MSQAPQTGTNEAIKDFSGVLNAIGVASGPEYQWPINNFLRTNGTHNGVSLVISDSNPEMTEKTLGVLRTELGMRTTDCTAGDIIKQCVKHFPIEAQNDVAAAILLMTYRYLRAGTITSGDIEEIKQALTA